MPTSVLEQIAEKVANRLAGITTDEGYAQDARVRRPKRIDTERPRDYLVKVTQEGKQRNETLSHQGNPPAQAWDVEFVIAAELRPSEKSTQSADTIRNAFETEVIQALTTVDSGDWCKWDGLAVISYIEASEPWTDEEDLSSGFQMSLVITYRTDENNPNNVRA